MSIDSDIVIAINGCNSPYMDELMWLISKPTTWIPLYVLLLVLMWVKIKDWRKMVIILVGFAIAVGLSDFICSGILKPIVCRLRPTHDPNMPMLHLVHKYRGGLYGFCSSHAANSMAVAVLFSLLYRKKTVTALLMVWVAAVCYSRMYLGVHYPTDILAGLAIGSLLAALTWLVLSIAYRVDDEESPRDDS
ncbi:MAG: phosphatase PAP2 family protein [Paludibacteraceae bacterium]|nr:phosphatase PAP2 family protein [Paludibacteraceae bacterium]